MDLKYLEVVQGRERWLALVDTVTNLWVP
jgi:hypothetical protein